MAQFNPITNCVEASNISGFMDVFIDGEHFSKISFTQSFQVHLIFNSGKCDWRTDKEKKVTDSISLFSDEIDVDYDQSAHTFCQEKKHLPQLNNSDSLLSVETLVEKGRNEDSVLTIDNTLNVIKDPSVNVKSEEFSLVTNDDDNDTISYVAYNDAVSYDIDNDAVKYDVDDDAVRSDVDHDAVRSDVDHDAVRSDVATNNYKSGFFLPQSSTQHEVLNSTKEDILDIRSKDIEMENVQRQDIKVKETQKICNKQLIKIRGIQFQVENRNTEKEKKVHLQGANGNINYECNYCKKKFDTKAQFLAHPRPKIEIQPSCKQCDQIFPQQSALIIHEVEVHGPGLVICGNKEGTGSFRTVCPVCKKEFCSKKTMINHLRIFHTNEYPFNCCLCDRRFINRKPYINHCESAHSSTSETEYKKHACNYCKKSFDTKAQLKDHSRAKSETSCKQCGQMFRGQTELILHEAKVHGPGLVTSRTDNGNSRAECFLCLQKVRLENLLQHVRSHHTKEPMFTCCVCNQGFLDRTHCYRHCESKHLTNFICKVCNFVCGTASVFDSHKSIHRKECRFCGEHFQLEKLLSQHYAEKHRDTSFECNHCDNLFPTMALLQSHKRNLRFSTLQPCPVCGVMIRRYSLKQHMISKHSTTSVKFQCSTCGKTYGSKKSLDRHVKEIHKNEQKHHCNQCSKVFTNSIYLDNHMRRHFSTKRHKCSICGKTTRTPYHLKIHMRVHSDTKMFSCNFCSEGFNYKQSLQSHMRSKHPDK